MRIATYVRVSTQEQALEGYSIDAQKERLSSYCKAKGWTLSAEYVDGGFSGSNLDRPQMQRMISDISKGLFDCVLVYKLDRLSRSQKDTLYLIEDVFLQNNIAFVSLNENFDTSTPFGRAMVGILSVFAQLEREQIKERTRMGLEERIKKGHHHSYAPFGYRLTENGLVIEPAEAEVIHKIFEMLRDNYSFQQIKDHIVKCFPEYPSFSTSKSNKISQIAHNITYGGYVKFGDAICKGTHEAIIEEPLFEKVTGILSKRKDEWERQRTKRTGTHSNYLLTGFVYCEECGARYRAVPKPTGAIYQCYSRYGSPPHMVKKQGCNGPILKADQLDTLILDELLKIKYNEDYFNSLKNAPVSDDTAQIIEKNKKEIEKLNSQIERLLDLYGIDGMDISILSAKIKSLGNKKALLEQSVVKIQEQSYKPSFAYDEVKSVLSDLESLINEKATDDLRRLLQLFLDKVIISKDGISVSWNFS